MTSGSVRQSFNPTTEMNSNSTKVGEEVTATTPSFNRIIPDNVMWQLNLYLYIILCGSLAIFGIVCNLINMIVFHRLGLKDSMSVCLFALSFTDFFVSCVILSSRIFFVWNIFYKGEGIDPLAVAYVGPSSIADALFVCSGWILTFLSLERCFCVIFPFKVKQIFTKNRSIAAIIIMYIIVATPYVPIYATQWLGWVDIEVRTNNGTGIRRRLIVMFSDNRQRVQGFVAIICSTVIPVPAMILTFASVLWMIYGLLASTRLRQAMVSKSLDGDEDKIKESKVTQKTNKLMKVVLILAVIFLLCSAPRMIANYIHVLLPYINEGGKERNLNNLIWSFTRVSASLNASVNIVVYLKINSSYREKFRELIPIFKSIRE